MGKQSVLKSVFSPCLRDIKGTNSKRQLSCLAVLGLSSCVVAFVLLSIAILVAYLILRSDDLEGKPILKISAAVLLIDIIPPSLGAVSYIYVCARAARPSQIHAHGVIFMLTLPEYLLYVTAKVFEGGETCLVSHIFYCFDYTVWGVRKTILILLIMQKLRALGPPSSRSMGPNLWARRMIITMFAATTMGVVARINSCIMHLRGFSCADVSASQALRFHDAEEPVPTYDKVIWCLIVILVFIAPSGFYVAGSVFLFRARQLIQAVLGMLKERNVLGDLYQAASRTLQQHFWGMTFTTISTFLKILGTGVDGLNMLFHEEAENLAQSLGRLVDDVGDVVGVLLLSGVGVLIFREDPEAGDISGHIRGLLQAAVMTARVDTVFEGRIGPTPGNCCIVSFPGKFLSDWNSLTWLCERGELSSACVFLPATDPHRRFGRHCSNDEDPGGQRCWCHRLYGEEKPWGCLWFQAWKENLDRAVELKLDLVVVYFPGQAGAGQVHWDDLGAADLWDGVGLGGSQKAEVAYLKHRGLKVIEEDVEATRLRMSSKKTGKGPAPG